MVSEWLSLLTLIAIYGIWLGAMRSRERALRAARRICSAQSVQLLDETVGLSGLRLRYREGPQLLLRYAFEVSLDGMDRHSGHLWMASGHVLEVSTDWPREGAHARMQAEHQVVQLLHRMRDDTRIGHDEDGPGST